MSVSHVLNLVDIEWPIHRGTILPLWAYLTRCLVRIGIKYPAGSDHRHIILLIICLFDNKRLLEGGWLAGPGVVGE